MSSNAGDEHVVLHVRAGEAADAGSWIYAWLGIEAGRGVVYVGATGLHPVTRAWLHLHDQDPEVGRVAALYPQAKTEPLDVIALRLPPDIPRELAKQAAIVAPAEHGLLSDSYFGEPLAATQAAESVAEHGEHLVELVIAHLAQEPGS